MKKFVSLCFGAAFIALSACQDVKESAEYKSVQSKNDSLESQLANKDQEIEEVAATVNEIENNLAAIEKDELSINQLKKEGQEQSQKDKINTMIASIDQYIEQNRQKIETLEQQVKKSRGRNAALQKLVTNLRATIAEKEGQIADLRNTIAGLETEVTGLRTTVSERDRSLAERDSTLSIRQRDIEERDTEIYTAYYVMGSKKELKETGILDKGGLFRKGNISSGIDKSKFTSINMRNLDDINLGVTKKKEVLSNHPKDSYYFTKVGEEVHVKITDYKRFWSLTKYLVVETK